jgi:hypothetical protein
MPSLTSARQRRRPTIARPRAPGRTSRGRPHAGETPAVSLDRPCSRQRPPARRGRRRRTRPGPTDARVARQRASRRARPTMRVLDTRSARRPHMPVGRDRPSKRSVCQGPRPMSSPGWARQRRTQSRPCRTGPNPPPHRGLPPQRNRRPHPFRRPKHPPRPVLLRAPHSELPLSAPGSDTRFTGCCHRRPCCLGRSLAPSKHPRHRRPSACSSGSWVRGTSCSASHGTGLGHVPLTSPPGSGWEVAHG